MSSLWNSFTSYFNTPEEKAKKQEQERQKIKNEINAIRQKKILNPIHRFKNLEKDNYNKIQYPLNVKENPNMTNNIKSQLSVQYYKEHILKKLENPIKLQIPTFRSTDTITLEYYIPKGTILYHASNDENIEFTKDRQTYFGFDIIISLWFLVELLTEESSYGIIHQFEVVNDIPVYILEDITNHPKGNNICKRKDIACIHPQYAYHGDPPYNFRELSSELTMNLTDDFFKNSIKRSIHPKLNVPIKYLVDVDQLRYYRKSGNFTVHRFNPIQPNKSKNSRILSYLTNKGYGSFYSAILGFYLPDGNIIPDRNIVPKHNENNEKTQQGGKSQKNKYPKKYVNKKFTKKRTI